MSEGWSYEKIEEMTVFDLDILTKWWEKNPRLDVLVRLIAQWCGVYKPPEQSVRTISPEEREAGMAAIMSQFTNVKINFEG